MNDLHGKKTKSPDYQKIIKGTIKNIRDFTSIFLRISQLIISIITIFFVRRPRDLLEIYFDLIKKKNMMTNFFEISKNFHIQYACKEHYLFI